MSVPNQPSHVRTVLELLRGNATVVHPSVASLITTLHTLFPAARIDTQWQDDWNKPDGGVYNAITVWGDGGLGVISDSFTDLTATRAQGRVQIRCWSTGFHVCNQGAMLVSEILMPLDPSHFGWEAASTRVLDVSGVSEPLEYEETEGQQTKRAMLLFCNVIHSRKALVTA